MSESPAPNETEMSSETLEALLGSIAKWRGIVAGTMKDEGQDNCPLCQTFYRGDCDGCPVKEHTGEELCQGTPYMDYTEERRYPVEVAQAELDFLISLLPMGAR